MVVVGVHEAAFREGIPNTIVHRRLNQTGVNNFLTSEPFGQQVFVKLTISPTNSETVQGFWLVLTVFQLIQAWRLTL